MTKRTTPNLGVHLLETVTKGLYANPLHCIREYVQNGYDSIRDARRKGILSEEEGEIVITLLEDEGVLKIRDNGTGLTDEEAVDKLISLGMSTKNTVNSGDDNFAGFRGIGRVAGITHCKTLQFTTSTGESNACKVEYNAEEINKMTKKGVKPVTMSSVLESNCDFDIIPNEGNERFFEVSMIGIGSAGKVCMDDVRVRDYLAQVAPVGYDPAKWPFGEEIRNIAEEFGALDCLSKIRIRIQRKGAALHDVRRNLQRTFGVTGRGKVRRNVSISGITKLPNYEFDGRTWWGWLAQHDREGKLDVPFSGLRIRAHNIEIGGNDIVRQLFTTKSLANWCVGEIHIVGQELTPNAGRDNFEDSAEWTRVKKELSSTVSTIEKVVRRESQNRNKSVNTIKGRSGKLMERAEQQLSRGFVSRDQKEKLVQDLQKEKKKVEEAANTRNRSIDEKKQLANMAEGLEKSITRIENVKKTGTDAALQHLDRKTKRAVYKILSILKDELSNKDELRRVEEKINEALQPGKRV